MRDSIPGKTCRMCGEFKSLGEYHKQSKAKDGHQNRCKDCAKRIAKEWYEANKDRALETQKMRRARNPDAYRSYLNDYYRSNKDKWETPEAREASRKRARRFTERCQAGDLEALAKKKTWNRLHSSKRRSRLRDAGILRVTTQDLDRLVARYRGLCAYCQSAPWEHLDHVIPVARGGRHSIGNLLPACAACNLTKGDRLIVEWRRYLANNRQLRLAV